MGPTRFGIMSLADLKDRCVLTSAGCWRYRLEPRGGLAQSPWKVNIWLAEEQRCAPLQRAAWTLAGNPLQRRWVVWHTCGEAQCANPAHLQAGPRAAMGRWQAGTGLLRGRPERRAINRRNRLASGTVLNEELAQWIRASSQTGVEVAHALGVRTSCVSRVRMGQTWAPVVRGASVFAWAAAAARA